VWQRVEPILRPVINEARDQRLIIEGPDRYRERRHWIVKTYSTGLPGLSPILMALSPTPTRFLYQDQGLADVLARNTDDRFSFQYQFFEAIHRVRAEVRLRKQERARHLRSLLPQTDVFKDATDDEAIALATSVYKCSDCGLSASGLHMLAHDCNGARKPGVFHPQLNEPGRETVKMLLRLLGLRSETTTLELDRRNDRFVCMDCPRVSLLQNGIEVLGRYVRDWRSCVRLILLLVIGGA
jgi:hypothetical protein